MFKCSYWLVILKCIYSISTICTYFVVFCIVHSFKRIKQMSILHTGFHWFLSVFGGFLLHLTVHVLPFLLKFRHISTDWRETWVKGLCNLSPCFVLNLGRDLWRKFRSEHIGPLLPLTKKEQLLLLGKMWFPDIFLLQGCGHCCNTIRYNCLNYVVLKRARVTFFLSVKTYYFSSINTCLNSYCAWTRAF